MKASFAFLLAISSWIRHIFGDPFALPLQALAPYYANSDTSAKSNPIPYDNYGLPPDHYPSHIADKAIPMPTYEYYGDENDTNPGIYDTNPNIYHTNECSTVRNCPMSIPDIEDTENDSSVFYPWSSYEFNPQLERNWGCIVEVDCFAQEKIPNNLSTDTEVLFLRSFSFTALKVGNLSVLPALVKLRIEYSDLATIEPGAFASQSTLEILELEGNAITNIESTTFSELKDLKSLDLSNNGMEEINRYMFQGLDSLTKLGLRTNLLHKIPNFVFAEMINLEDINLDNNNITHLENDSFSGLSKLKILSLSDNRLRSVPSAALRMPSALINLHLTGNPIQTIHRNDFKGLEKIEVLWLNDCELNSIEKRAFHNKMFKTLSLSDNYLTFVPNLGTMKLLKDLRIDHNRWHCDCKMTITVKWLRRNRKKLQSLQDPECSTPSYFRGRSVLELSNDDLCSPPPIKPEVVTESVRMWRTIPTYEKENAADESGWSDQVYDIENSYTASDLETESPTLPATFVTRTTTPVEVRGTETSTKETYTTDLNTITTHIMPTRPHKEKTTKVTHAFTARHFTREISSTPGGTKIRFRSTVDSTIKTSKGRKSTTSTSTSVATDHPINKPDGGTSAIGIIIPVVVVMMLGCILFVIGYKIFMCKRKAKLSQKKERELELVVSNGTHNCNAAEEPQVTPPLKEKIETSHDDTVLTVGT